jgi:hypothetical protein
MIPWMLAAVVATSEFCADEPVTAGHEEPAYCYLQKTDTIETPYFSITIEAGFNVAVDRGGRRLMAQPVLRQSPATLDVEVFEVMDPTRVSGCTKEIEFEQDGLTWRECLRESSEAFWRILTTRVRQGEAIVQYQYSPMGTIWGPALERMLQSTRIKITTP